MCRVRLADGDADATLMCRSSKYSYKYRADVIMLKLYGSRPFDNDKNKEGLMSVSDVIRTDSKCLQPSPKWGRIPGIKLNDLL